MSFSHRDIAVTTWRHCCEDPKAPRSPPRNASRHATKLLKELDVSMSARVATTAQQPGRGSAAVAAWDCCGCCAAVAAVSKECAAVAAVAAWNAWTGRPWRAPAARTHSCHAASAAWRSSLCAWHTRFSRRRKLPPPWPMVDLQREPSNAEQNKQVASWPPAKPIQ
eukprot:9469900-Pyramimonas_sp.AAC.1